MGSLSELERLFLPSLKEFVLLLCIWLLVKDLSGKNSLDSLVCGVEFDIIGLLSQGRLHVGSYQALTLDESLVQCF